MLAVSVIPAVVARFRSIASSLQQRKCARRQQLTLKIEGRRYVTTDWSLGGAKLGRFDQPLKRGTLLEGRIGGIRGVKGKFLARVMHVNEQGEVALQWDEMSSSCYAALATVPRY